MILKEIILPLGNTLRKLHQPVKINVSFFSLFHWRQQNFIENN